MRQPESANGPHPLYTCEDDTHSFAFADDTRIQIVEPVMHHERLYGQMLAWSGADLLNDAEYIVKHKSKSITIVNFYHIYL